MKKLVLLSVWLLVSVFCLGQNDDRYNYSRGYEELGNYNMDEAYKYFFEVQKKSELYSYAQYWISIIQKYKGNYGQALSAINSSLDMLPKKDKSYRSSAYNVRGNIYETMKEYDRAINDYTLGIKVDQTVTDNYEDRGNLYYQLEEYEKSNWDYKKYIDLKPSEVMGYMGIGRNLNAMEKYNEAVEIFNYVVKMYPEYSSGYAFRADSYFQLKKYNESANDVITALSIDHNDKAWYFMRELADSAFLLMSTMLKVQCNKEPNNSYWTYALGIINEDANKYVYALSYYKEAFQKDVNAIICQRIANCYGELGNYNQALKYINQAIDLDSTDSWNEYYKTKYEYGAGLYQESLLTIKKWIKRFPEYYYGYYYKAFIEDNLGKVDEAIEDYTVAITLAPDYSYSYLGRADQYMKKGMKSLAEADYKKVIVTDTIPNSNSCAQYAYLELGNMDKSKAFMQEILTNYGDDSDYYDAACLYSRMGETNLAVSYLRTSLEKGFRRFSHIEQDDDLDNIRNLPEFKALIKEYESIVAKEIADAEEIEGEYVEKVAEIQFTKSHGVCEVKCTINGLPLSFIFDTGASDVTMSSVEANFMYKNHYLSEQDIMGKQYYQVADGGISEGTVVNIRNVNFGGLNLNNIKASIVKSQNAPLLLGQSALQKLGKIEIDNEKNVIRITYKEKK